MLTVTQLKSKVNSRLRGTTLNKVAGFYDKLGEAAGLMLLRTDPFTTIRRHKIQNAIYDQVYSYTAPTDIKGLNKIVDLRPLALRDTDDNVFGAYSREFDIKKEYDSTTLEYINGTPTLRLSKQLDSRIVISEMESLTLGAIITGSGDVTNLTTNTLDYIAGSKSIEFGLSGVSGVGTINIALTETIDLSELEKLASFFNWQKFPDVSRLTSVVLRVGNDASNYFEMSIDSAHDRVYEDNAWQLNRYDWSAATEAGTVDSSAIDYIDIIFNYSTGDSLTGVKLDCMTVSLGEAWELLYYSNSLFRGTDGTYKRVPTADSDVILLNNTDGENILFYELMDLLQHELKGIKGRNDVNYFRNKLDGEEGLYDAYNSQYPSQAIEAQTNYYKF